MASTLIATTERGSFNALRFQGILITESHAQLASMLENSLSQEHALLFAEPVHDTSGATTDWYSPVQGTPVRLSELPYAEQVAAKETIVRLASDLSRLSEELKASDVSAKSIRGNILGLAMAFPGQEHMYVINGQPVITCWGFAPGTIGAQPEDLMRLGAAVPPPPPPPPADVPPPPPSYVAKPSGTFIWWHGLLWLLLGLLFLAALFFLAGLLFGPAGCVKPGAMPPGCSAQERAGCAVPAREDPGTSPQGESQKEKPAPEVPPTKQEEQNPPADPSLVSALTAEQEKERSLRRQLEDLRRQLEERAKLCSRQEPPRAEAPKPAPTPEEPKPEPPKEEPQPEEPPSLADLMPTTPEEPPVPETPEPAKPQPQKEKPKDKPKEKPQPPKVAKGEELRIPEEARKNKDVKFLEGCWNSDSGLVARNSGEPLDVQYCFDANGRGSRTITKRKTNDRCAGSVRARFDGSGRLVIDADGAACNKGGGFVPQRVDCTQGSGSKATCEGQERGGARNRWNAKFTRK